MKALRTRSIPRRVVVTLLVAQLAAMAVSLLLVYLLTDLSPDEVFLAIAVIGTVSAIATIGAGAIVARSISAQVSHIAEEGSFIAKGNFGHRMTRPTITELALIGDSLDTMASQLSDRVASVQRLETLRSDFAANVSHELRTPITNIKGYIETLLEFGLDDREEAQRYLDIIRVNSSRLAAIVEDIMALSKFESTIDESMEESDPILIADLLSSAGRQFDREAAAREIKVVVDHCGDLSIRGHRQLLEQAISNLVSNAIRYGHPGTDVTLRATANKDLVSIEVADTGPGIESEHLPRLFERFYRVDKARSRAVGGTGLGLAIVKHIAIKHGGSVEAISELGEGSVFRIELPVTLPAQIS